MKKLTTLLIICCMALMLTFGLTACGDKTCEHIYDNACDAICNECEETRTITHDWNAADCDTPKTCSICKAIEGEALGHTAEADDGNLHKLLLDENKLFGIGKRLYSFAERVPLGELVISAGIIDIDKHLVV